MKIRTKAILIFLTLSLVPLAAIGWFAYKNGEETIRQSLGASFQQIAAETIDKVDRSLYEVYQNVQTWAELEFFQEVITGDVDAKISSFLVGVSQEYGYFSDLTVINADGEAVASNNIVAIGKSFRDEDCFQANGGEPYVGDVHLSPMSKVWVITFAFPITAKFDEGKVIGVLCASWKAEELSVMTQTRDIDGRSHGNLTLLRGDGLVISVPDQERRDIFRRNLLTAGMRAARLATGKGSGYLVERDERGRTWVVGYDYSKGYRDFQGLGWVALVAQDVKIAFEPIERLKFIVLGLGAGVAFCVIVISLFLAQRMATPILKISQVAHRVAKGDFDVGVEHISGDELGSLARTFNQMIQDLKRQRAQLVDKAYVDNVIQSMIDTLVVIDPAGRIRTVNKATCQLLGYAEDELVGQPMSRIFADDLAGEPANMDAWIEERLLKNVENWYRSKDGRRIPMRCSSAILRDEDGRVQGIVCVAQDITERKLAEEAMRRHAAELARSNAELEQFAYIASHDLQEPLRTISSYTQLLVRRYKDKLDTDANEFMVYVVTGTTRMQALINDLLLYSRVGTRAKPLEPTDCSTVVDDATRSLKVAIQESGAEVSRDQLPVVKADASQLGQVFQNLIGNAIKFRKPGLPPRVRISAQRQGDSWEFSVTDNGIGIDPRYADRIFVIFQRLHTQAEYPGTGIGLAVCKKIIERHGGRIWVEAAPGEGAAFHFTIPANGLGPATHGGHT